jgi:hypothetical protein
MLWHNPDIVVEIGVDNSTFIHSQAIDFIRDIYKDRFHIHKVEWHYIKINEKFYPTCPHIVRFITTPEIKNEYIYFNDVDMLTLEKNITDINIAKMAENGMTYNNIVRPDGVRMTGLHFTRWDNYYPLEDFEELAQQGLMGHDENFLCAWMRKKGNVIKSGFIPQHGIHLCPNQELKMSHRWHDEWMEYRCSEEFKTLEKWFSNRIAYYVRKTDCFMEPED